MATASPSTLYDVLGVRSGATCREIKAVYRRLARECHPDVVVAEKKGESADEFIRIHAAYTTLSDPYKRADYDCGVVIGRPRWSPRGWRVFSASGSHHPIFTGSTRRTWETDQCW
ncbi:chaperone protein dnaJ 11, chloroplastic-like [Typha latifolia]|uniref:chaperone protein dnaJ 11, chloroplastic-like n=1 Tax=Typha latifolia TaxID=4733 RepID=UPI003C2E82E1